MERLDFTRKFTIASCHVGYTICAESIFPDKHSVFSQMDRSVHHSQSNKRFWISDSNNEFFDWTHLVGTALHARDLSANTLYLGAIYPYNIGLNVFIYSCTLSVCVCVLTQNDTHVVRTCTMHTLYDSLSIYFSSRYSSRRETTLNKMRIANAPCQYTASELSEPHFVFIVFALYNSEQRAVFLHIVDTTYSLN